MRIGYPCIMSIFFLTLAVGATDWDQCLINIRNESWRIEHNIFDGATDSHGQPIPFSENTTAITYHTCTLACGSGPEPIKWPVFSQQFSSWLLPWLALVSQLPFGANDKLDNLVATLLTVGSPTLAAYSLVLTLLNGRWITRRFVSCNYPNTKKAVRIFSSLQQSPLKVRSCGPLLPSLIVLPKNDEWWKILMVNLHYTHTWSISAAVSITWVIIAYVFTVVDSFTGDMLSDINFTGQAIGSMWLWLLPIVLGWLQISPKCDSMRLWQAVERANEKAHVAGSTVGEEPKVAGEYAISLGFGSGDLMRCDEECTGPIYNYARFLSCVEAVEIVASAFHTASENARKHIPVRRGDNWDREHNSRNRMGTREQVENYCRPGEPTGPCVPRSAWRAHVCSRIFIASAMALGLQWGTTGAAVVAQWFTPTIGLGCRSGSYILYAATSTLVWLLLLLSSFLSYYVTTSQSKTDPAVMTQSEIPPAMIELQTPPAAETPAPTTQSDNPAAMPQSETPAALKTQSVIAPKTPSVPTTRTPKIRTVSDFKFLPWIARLLSILLRRAGKVLAACNAIWIVVACAFQFSNFFDRCWCNSSVLMWKGKAYGILKFRTDDLHGFEAAWIGGVGLAAGTAVTFIIFGIIFINPKLPAQAEEQ